MKTLSLFIVVFAMVQQVSASNVYINGGRVQEALDAIYTTGSPGFGGIRCELCHETTSGGPGQLNSTFGTLFQQTSQNLGFGTGGNNLAATGSNSLQLIFQDSTFAAADPDGDTLSNDAEFQANSDPSGNGSSSSSGGDGGGGGCGMISGGSGTPPWSGLFLLLLPLILIGFKSRKPATGFAH